VGQQQVKAQNCDVEGCPNSIKSMTAATKRGLCAKAVQTAKGGQQQQEVGLPRQQQGRDSKL